MSTPEMPSTIAWWVLVRIAKRSRSSPCASHSSQSGLERSSCWEKTRPASRFSCVLAARLGQRGVADVVGQVEVDVVGPERPAGLQRRHDQLLAEARHLAEAPAHVLDQVDVAAAAAPRRSGSRRRACGCWSSRWSGTRRRPRSGGRGGVLRCSSRKASFARLPGPPGTAAATSPPLPCSHGSHRHRRSQARPARRPARLLRRRRPRRADGRAGARAARRPRLRAQGDRPQQARGRGARQARRDLRRGGDRGAGGRDGRLLRPRRRPGGPRQRRRPQPAHDRRHLPAGHQGPRRGPPLRRRGLHDRDDRPRGPRGGRRDDRRGPRQHRPDRNRRRGRVARGPRSRARSPSSPRPRSRSTRRRRSSPPCAPSSRRSSAPSPTTSVTRRPTARSPSSSWPASATWSW